MSTIDRLRLYVAPRGAYLRSTVDLEDGVGVASNFDTTTSGYLASGSFGAQFSVHDRFALVGELGLQYHVAELVGVVPVVEQRQRGQHAGPALGRRP